MQRRDNPFNQVCHSRCVEVVGSISSELGAVRRNPTQFGGGTNINKQASKNLLKCGGKLQLRCAVQRVIYHNSAVCESCAYCTFPRKSGSESSHQWCESCAYWVFVS